MIYIVLAFFAGFLTGLLIFALANASRIADYEAEILFLIEANNELRRENDMLKNENNKLKFLTKEN